MLTFPHKIHGIPCQISVTSFNRVKGSPRGQSSADFNGYVETDFEVLDTRGRKASWLERKMSSQEDLKVRRVITEMMED